MTFKLTILLAGVGILCLSASAQTRRPFVNATGRGSVAAVPDQVKIDATVTTQAATAQDATAQNADRTAKLLAALRKLLGSNADIKTINVTVNPVYRNSQNDAPVIVAYIASNSVEVTLTVSSNAGAVIDTATQNGATSVGSLQFGLKDPEPARLQALRLATQQAKAHADAMAFGLGRTVGAVLSIQESASGAVPILSARGDAAATPTPVEIGTLDVSATVILEAELN